MNKQLILLAIAAGFSFGIYPLFLNKSQLSGTVMSAIFTFLVFLCLSPFLIGQMKPLVEANWWMLSVAAVSSAIGMFCMTRFIATSTPSVVSTLIVLMVVVQALVTSSYQIVVDKGLSLAKGAGFLCALAAIVLLNKK